MLKNNVDTAPNNEAKEWFKKKQLEARRGIREFAEYANNSLINIRKGIKGEKKKAHRREDTTVITKKMINSWLYDYTGGSFYLQDNFDWNQIDLCIFTFDQYFKELALKSNMKLEENDILDLLNLVYVSPNGKYWTHEKRKWARLIYEDDIYKNYLYKPERL